MMQAVEFDTARIAADYYEQFTGKQLSEEQRQTIRAMIGAGLAAADVFRAVDLAASRWGMCGTAQDYWRDTLEECRRRWRELQAAGLIEKMDKPP